MAESGWDAWMVESLRRYNDLHVFELQEPTRVLEWIQDRSVCVAGYSAGRKNEIQELSLPQKLSAKEKQGLCPERDFHVEHGGFSQRPIYQLKHIAGTSLLVSSGPPDSSLQVWCLAADESDTISLLTTSPLTTAVSEWSRISVSCSPTPRVLHGSKISDLAIQEIVTQSVLFSGAGVEDNEPISKLDFLDHSTFIVCSMNGHLWLADTRQCPSLIGHSSLPASSGGGSHWTMGLAPGCSMVGRLSSAGQVVVTDYRDLSKALGQVELAVPRPLANSDHLCLTWAPRLQQHLAVSGFNGNVHIYDTSSWSSSPGRVEPTFVHRGHSVSAEPEQDLPLVTTHTWHPWKERVLLSAADDGSLHVWDWTACTSA
ncbi:WD repeat-containing protein 73 isoform X2 [Pristis pectinata]|uniref:WD repeat-containing protein 73 isoform X2 n=1 Tax=Pristis pectinata TaxID=685728 RepID=UPI00223D44FA|nr:WD repeat-containing protein 73 isoform X2 [Pristis pectinata]